MQVIYGVKDICAALDCERDRLQGLIAAGAPVRVYGPPDGRRYLADLGALEAWVQCREKPTPADTR